MIFTESTIKISNNVSKMDSTIVLYRGDKNVEIRFTILQSPFKYSNTVATNIIESTNASYGQLVIKTPNDKPPIFSEVSATKEGTILFTITKEMIDEIEEVGVYTFQIRLMDENKQSRATIPPVENGIEIKEPIAIEDDNTTNVVGLAKANYAVATLSDADIPTFDDNGKYNKTNWNDGDIITNASLNKIEDGIYTTNENVNTKSVFTNTQLDNKFGALNFTGSLNTGLNKSMTLSEVFPDILDGKYGVIKQCKLTVKVDGATIVNLTENYNMVQWQMYDNDNNLLSTAYSKPKVVRNVYFTPNDYVQFICWLDATYTPGASGSGISYDTPGYITVMLNISRSKNTEEYINKIKNLRITATLRVLNALPKDNKIVYTPTEDYNPATKKYVDDNRDYYFKVPTILYDDTNLPKGYVDITTLEQGTNYRVNSSIVSGFFKVSLKAPNDDGTWFTVDDGSNTIGWSSMLSTSICVQLKSDTFIAINMNCINNYCKYLSITKENGKWKLMQTKLDSISPDNTYEYDVTNDYNPAHKKYVDDNTPIKSLPVNPTTKTGAVVDVNNITVSGCYALPKRTDGKHWTNLMMRAMINDGSGKGKSIMLSGYQNFVFHVNIESKKIYCDNLRIVYNIGTTADTTDIRTEPYYLPTTNTKEYAPTNDYNPATKKYVDDNKIAYTVSSKVLTTVPASSIKLGEPITVNNITLNKDRKYYIEFLGSKELCNALRVQNSISLGRVDDTGAASSAVGMEVQASGMAAHAEGYGVRAAGNFSHAEGSFTEALNEDSHAEGYSTIAASMYQHVQGKNNIEDNLDKYAHIVGNGEDLNNRSNAHTLDWQGNAWYAGKLSQEGTPTENKDLATKKYVDDNTVIHPLPIYKIAETDTMITYMVNIMDLKTLTTYGAIRDMNSTKYQRYRFIYPCDDGKNKTIINTGDDINDTTFRVYHYSTSSTLTFNNVRYSVDYTKHNTSTDVIVTDSIQNYLGIYNTREYAPTENYHPATKKYVDDKVSSLPQFSFNENGELVVTINGVSKTFVPKNV